MGRLTERKIPTNDKLGAKANRGQYWDCHVAAGGSFLHPKSSLVQHVACYDSSVALWLPNWSDLTIS